jgi:hypothetical protein
MNNFANSSFSPTFAQLEFILYNVFSGANNLALGIDTQVHYPEIYKILSFSPLVSTIDGFSDYMIYRGYITTFMPFNVYTELYYFGTIYCIIFFLIVYIVVRLSNKIVVQYKIFGYLFIAPLYLFFISAQQYPIRNYFRYMLVIIIIYYLLKYYQYCKIKRHIN